MWHQLEQLLKSKRLLFFEVASFSNMLSMFPWYIKKNYIENSLRLFFLYPLFLLHLLYKFRFVKTSPILQFRQWIAWTNFSNEQSFCQRNAEFCISNLRVWPASVILFLLVSLHKGYISASSPKLLFSAVITSILSHKLPSVNNPFAYLVLGSLSAVLLITVERCSMLRRHLHRCVGHWC